MLCVLLRITSWFAAVLWVSRTQAPLVFRDSCFGSQSLQWESLTVGAQDMGSKPFGPRGEAELWGFPCSCKGQRWGGDFCYCCCAAQITLTQLCQALCDPVDCSRPGSSVPTPRDLPDPGTQGLSPCFLQLRRGQADSLPPGALWGTQDQTCAPCGRSAKS